jgi:hypothetical protein
VGDIALTSSAAASSGGAAIVFEAGITAVSAAAALRLLLRGLPPRCARCGRLPQPSSVNGAAALGCRLQPPPQRQIAHRIHHAAEPVSAPALQAALLTCTFGAALDVTVSNHCVSNAIAR